MRVHSTCAAPTQPPSCRAARSSGVATRRVSRRHQLPLRSPRCTASPGAEAELVRQEAAPITRRILQSLSGDAAGGAGGGKGTASTWDALQRADAAWTALRTGSAAAQPAPPFAVRRAGGIGSSTAAPPFDVVVCGGTLGVFYAAALATQGLRVCVVERGPLVGRSQDWNISRAELQALVAAGALSRGDADDAVTTSFNPGRCAFHGAADDGVLVRDVLNLGVSPAKLVAAALAMVSAAPGCVVLEQAPITALEIFDDGVHVLGCTQPDGSPITGKLVLDCMGHASPIVRQVRNGKRPDGICLVVGTCATGFDANNTSDIICTAAPMQRMGDDPGLKQQCFWEAFPAGSGPRDRTTYLFTYIDADAARPSLTALLESYWPALEAYQGVRLDSLDIQRVLFGCFPTYRDSPLRMPAPLDRLLCVGDASGIQSPLSFGGVAALSRHLGRVTRGVAHALRAGATDARSLGQLNPYMPNLSGTWLFQRAMSAPRGTAPADDFVNTLLSTNFGVMQRLGDSVLRPFLQDVPQFGALTATLANMMATRPLLIPRILVHVGPEALLDWFRHYLLMGLYSLLWTLLGGPLTAALQPRGLATRLLPPRAAYTLSRWLDAWQYGSGLDYGHH